MLYPLPHSCCDSWSVLQLHTPTHHTFWPPVGCRILPIVSNALAGCILSGSTQHSSLAHGLILITSGGSTPMFRHSTSATAVVLSLSFCRHFDTRPCSLLRRSPRSSPASWRSCRHGRVGGSRSHRLLLLLVMRADSTAAGLAITRVCVLPRKLEWVYCVAA